MKVIYKDELRAVVDDDGEGLWLESMGEPARRVHAPYGSEELNVDPTDAEVAEVLGGSFWEPEHG